jgi:hypothetical protein
MVRKGGKVVVKEQTKKVSKCQLAMQELGVHVPGIQPGEHWPGHDTSPHTMTVTGLPEDGNLEEDDESCGFGSSQRKHTGGILPVR